MQFQLLMMSLTLLISLIFMMSAQLIIMGISLLTQTMMISMFMGFHNSTYWYSYMLILILIGGIFILYFYMISINTSTKKSKFNKLIYLMMLSLLILLNWKLSLINLPSLYNFKLDSLTLMYTISGASLTFMIMIYLLVTLTISMNISFQNKFTLRTLN